MWLFLLVSFVVLVVSFLFFRWFPLLSFAWFFCLFLFIFGHRVIVLMDLCIGHVRYRCRSGKEAAPQVGWGGSGEHQELRGGYWAKRSRGQ
jgi:hypothetical protein